MKKLRVLVNFINKYIVLLYGQLKKDFNDYKIRISDEIHCPVNFKELMEQDAVFVLSTGRCGTRWLTELLKKSQHLNVEHDPLPKIYFQSQFVYKHKFDNNAVFSSFVHARYQYLFDSFCINKTYVETNNRITFYAQAIAESMPNARFVHIVRHPYEVIRSGMRRGWYGKLNCEFSGHIIPRKGEPAFSEWDNYSREQKIAWLWKETNKIIEKLKFENNSDQIMTITSADMFNDEVSLMRLLHFMGAYDIVSKKTMLIKFQGKIINNQCSGDYPDVNIWEKEALSDIKLILKDTNLYGFKL